MKQNFTNEEIGNVVLTLNSTLGVNVRVNKAGNLTVTNPKTAAKEQWTLYRTVDGLLWRRLNLLTLYTYPLNMVHRNDMEKRIYQYNDGTTYTYSYWDMRKHCYFHNLNDALNYFISYYNNRNK